MKKIITILLGVVMLWTVSGCATIVTSKPDADTEQDGIRVYPPKVYVFVNVVVNKKKYPPETTVLVTRICLPDYMNGYDVKPKAILSKNNFNIILDMGQIAALNSNMDSTAMVEVFKAAIAASSKLIPSPMTLKGGKEEAVPGYVYKPGESPIETGIYSLDADGVLKKLKIDNFQPKK